MKTRTKIFLAFLAIVMLWGGGQGVYTTVTNLKPSLHTVRNYIDNKPNSKWLQLSGATLDMSGVTYASFLGVGEIKQIYVPVIPTGQNLNANEQIHILLATKDQKLLEIAKHLRGLNSEAEVKRYLSAHARDLYISKDIEGLVRFGLEFKSSDKFALQRENPNLAKDFIVIDEGMRPDYAVTALLFICGVALAAWLILGVGNSRKVSSSSIPPPLPGFKDCPPPMPPKPPPPLPSPHQD